MLAGPREERFESLDVLRGVAVLGILAINMQAMAQPASIFENPSLLGESFGESGHWWAIASTFFQFKFITIFSALFGAGIILMVGEEKPSGGRVAIHYRRMFWLLLFGLTHAFAIWFGDILTPYALAGFIVVLARRWSPRRLIVVGMLLISILGLAILAQAVMLPHMPPEEAEKIFADMLATPEQVQAEIAALKGAWPMRIADTWETPLQFQLIQGLALLPRNIGVMMIGMALYKMGFFTLRWSTLSYLIAAAICLPIGIYGSAWATAQYQVHNFEMLHLMPGQAALYWVICVCCNRHADCQAGACEHHHQTVCSRRAHGAHQLYWLLIRRVFHVLRPTGPWHDRRVRFGTASDDGWNRLGRDLDHFAALAGRISLWSAGMVLAHAHLLEPAKAAPLK